MATIYRQYGASQAVRVGDLLFIGGIVAMNDTDGATIAPNDGVTQAKVIYRYVGELLAAHGADALGFISSSRCTGEENYLLQKHSRAAFGTNNCHQCAAT